jgi:cytochrome c biogenesis protein CcmG/thiol:disulfide interchange protein DsbE
LLLILVAAASLFIACSGSRRGIYPGEIAPDVVGLDLAGKPLALHQVNGRVVLVNFWATWCAPCMAELPALERLYQSLRERGFTVLGVAVDDSIENIREAVARNGVTYPVLLDEQGKSKRLFELKGFPESFVLDAEKRVLIINDPAEGVPVTKIIGPREWSQSGAVQVFAGILG